MPGCKAIAPTLGRSAAMRTIFLAAATLASIALARPVTETRKLPDFKAIDASGGVELDVKKGAPQIVIEGDDDAIAKYEISVTNETLVIKRKPSLSWGGKERFVVHATTGQLERLEASGGVKVTMGDVPTPTLKVDLSGGVELSAPALQTSKLDFEASGGVNATLAGASPSARIDVSGGVELKAGKLEVKDLSVDASGGCNLDVVARDSLRGDLSGGVGMKVHGRAPKGRVETSGGAGVTYVD